MRKSTAKPQAALNKSQPHPIVVTRRQQIQPRTDQDDPPTPGPPPTGDEYDKTKLNKLRNRHTGFHSDRLDDEPLNRMHFDVCAVCANVPERGEEIETGGEDEEDEWPAVTGCEMSRFGKEAWKFGRGRHEFHGECPNDPLDCVVDV